MNGLAKMKKASKRGLAIVSAIGVAGAIGMNARATTHTISGNFNNSGTITGQTTDTYIFTGGTFTNSGTFANAGALQSSDVISNSGTFTQTGPMSQSANFTNSGNATFGGTQSWSSGVIYTNSAGTTHFNSDMGSASASNLSLTISGGGVVMASDQHVAQITNAGSLSFQSSGNMTISGPIGGNGSLSQTGNGTTILNGNYTATGSVSISAGKLTFAATSNTRETSGVVLKMSSLSIAPTSVLDVTNHDLIIGNTTSSAVQTEILNGFGSGPGGAQITSSTAISDGNKFLVPISATAYGITSWDNVPVTSPNTVIVKYTYFGDINLDGQVDAGDYAALDGFFGPPAGPGGSIVGGDADLSGVVDAGDYAFLDNFFGLGTTGAGPLFARPTVVPEAGTIALIGLGATMFLRRGERKSSLR